MFSSALAGTGFLQAGDFFTRILATLGIAQTSFLQDSWLHSTKLKQV